MKTVTLTKVSALYGAPELTIVSVEPNSVIAISQHESDDPEGLNVDPEDFTW